MTRLPREGRRTPRGALVLALALTAIAACGQALSAEDRIRLWNETTTPVAVHVNGGWAGTYPAGAVVDVPILGHGGPPFRIEVRSPSGAVLTEVTFSAENAREVAEGSSSMSNGGDVGCGWIEIGYGGEMAPTPDLGATKPAPAGVCP